MHPFLQACWKRNLSEVKTTLQSTDTTSRKELFQLTNDHGNNCLHLAALHERSECMMYLLTFNELDVTATCHTGRTALEFVLCRGKDGVTEIVRRLHEINNNLINRHTRSGYPLQLAIVYQNLDVVKLLIELGSLVNNKSASGRTALATAASTLKIDVIRYLLYETDCDASVADSSGWLPCHSFFSALLKRNLPRPPSTEEIAFFVEFLLFSYKSPADTVEVYFMLLKCFRAQAFPFYTPAHVLQAHKLFMAIVKLLVPHSPRKHFLEKLIDAKLPRDYCLITLTLFEHVAANIDNCKLGRSQIELHLGYLQKLKCYFLEELFTLYVADESFFHEYIAEVASLGWKFDEFELMSKFRPAKETSGQLIFDFMKSLLLHGFDVVSLTKPSVSSLLPPMANNLLTAFVPLSNFVNAPLELMWMFRGDAADRYFSFNESEHFLNDYSRLVDRKADRFEVVSLKNMARMAVRRDIFERHTQYTALSLLYSLHIPIELRQFLCYNQSNMKF